MSEQSSEKVTALGRWRQLEPAKVDRSVKTKAEGGVRLEVSLSPYDIPEAYRGYYSKARGRFVIEFKYPTSEPTREKKLDLHLVAIEGKRSGRLYGLEVDVDELGASDVELILSVSQMLSSHSHRAGESDEPLSRDRVNGRILDVVSEDMGEIAALSE